MSQNQLPPILPPDPSKKASHGFQRTQLQSLWLKLARILWICIVVSTYALLIVNIPAYFASLHMLRATNVQAVTGQLTVADVHRLQAWGLSLDFYAASMVGISLLFQFSYATMGVLLFWRKPDSRIAFFTSFALMMLPFGFANLTLQGLPPSWSWLIPLVSALGNGSLLLCAFVFPDGRFVPRWTRWLAAVMLVYWAMVALLPSWSLDRSLLSMGLFLGFILVVLLIQLYRYHTTSSRRQRQQIKWVIFAIVLAALVNIGARFLFYLVLLPLMPGGSLAYALENCLIMCAMLPIPITLAIAILASHLWDIDRLINRTLVYGTLTISLGLVYAGLVIAVQFLLHDIIGPASNSQIALVISTLAIAALFQPLRRRIQAIIDRRFYRRKYDAARTIAEFSATLRNEVDLDQLSEHLIAVVQETMQPAHVSLWLRKSEHERKSNPLSNDF